jgi:hypothetical protein
MRGQSRSLSARARGHVTPIEEPGRIVLPYRLLIESRSDLAEFGDAKRELYEFRSAAQYAATHWMLALCVFGRFDDGWWLSELVRPIIFERLPMTSHVADYTFFRGVAAAACARQSRGPQRWRLLRAARQSQRYLRRWAREGPDFAHMATPVQAGRAWAHGRSGRALDLYETAARAADDASYPHHAALAHERRAELLSALGREPDASDARARARDLYRSWGAEAKVRALG